MELQLAWLQTANCKLQAPHATALVDKNGICNLLTADAALRKTQMLRLQAFSGAVMPC